MGLLNFVDTGFIIILAILLLISGGIMFYCYRRLNLLEESIISQGKILQNLIINLQNNNLNSNNNNVNNNENNNVDYNVDNIRNNNIINDDNNGEKNYNSIVNLDNTESENNKIHVSDDDESYSESEDEVEENDDENNSEISDTNESMSIKDELSDEDVFEDENNSDLNNVNFNNKLLEQSLMSISMKLVDNTNDDIKILQLSDDLVKDKTFIENNDLDLEKDNEENKDLIEIEEISTSKNQDFVNSDKKSEQKIKGINKMKLDDLKQLVIDRNINLEEDVNNMKKADLIKILSN
jgi:hypothetical protein